jgi:hypothetical protein
MSNPGPWKEWSRGSQPTSSNNQAPTSRRPISDEEAAKQIERRLERLETRRSDRLGTIALQNTGKLPGRQEQIVEDVESDLHLSKQRKFCDSSEHMCVQQLMHYSGGSTAGLPSSCGLYQCRL